MTNQEIREYAEAVIVAFERKKPIKAKLMKVSHSKQVVVIVAIIKITLVNQIVIDKSRNSIYTVFGSFFIHKKRGLPC